MMLVFLGAILPAAGVNNPTHAEAYLKDKNINQPLYLTELAEEHIDDITAFSNKVYKVAADLTIEPDWIMAVIDSESEFHPTISNRNNSGAKGLIQFMDFTLRELGYKKLPTNPINQLDLVKAYLFEATEKYGKINSVADLKIAILYPKALNKPNSHVLWKKRSAGYHQNRGLDANKDGMVTVLDIERSLQKKYPELWGLPPQEGFARTTSAIYREAIAKKIKSA
ncbi:MAG TPA: transglycosylase SLT domain-containing protein [Chitinophagales bacterium]|nr:transglycosylase SLT domain-containing protein [Chitinophagales bacterium]